jgi:Fic family protein
MLVEERLYSRILEKKKRLDALRPFNEAIEERLNENLIIEWTYNSNAIEGNTLNLKDTLIFLKFGTTAANKPIRDFYEAANHRDAINYLFELVRERRKLEESDVRHFQALLTSKTLDEKYCGYYRDVHVGIRGDPSARFPSPREVPALMKKFVAYVKENPDKLNPVELGAVAHFRFVSIHPFVDGNGRTTRILNNYLLMKAGFPPIVIKMRDRRRYFALIKKAHLTGDLKPFVNFIAREVYLELISYLMQTDPEFGDIISLKEATKYCDYGEEYLSLRARQGKLYAVKIGGVWKTTKQAVLDYVKSVKR